MMCAANGLGVYLEKLGDFGHVPFLIIQAFQDQDLTLGQKS